ncbi:MAG: hypothetical protein ACKVVP_15545 [Chloroflexota bacterium]
MISRFLSDAFEAWCFAAAASKNDHVTAAHIRQLYAHRARA